jgi:hypothetical protein
LVNFALVSATVAGFAVVFGAKKQRKRDKEEVSALMREKWT